MNLLMIDDHVMFLQGLKNLLGVLAPKVRVDCADGLAQAAGYVSGSTYQLVLLDWHLAECEGDEALHRLRDAGCAAPIVVLSGETSTALVHHAIEAGAAGFIPKRYSSEMMVSALNHILAGRMFLPREDGAMGETSAPAATLESDPRLSGLTPRQLDVYRAAARGLSNKLIARELGIAGSTVKTHLSAVYSALGVGNRTEAAYQAAREGILLFPSLHDSGA